MTTEIGSCMFVRDGGSFCGAATLRAVSARRPLSDVWEAWLVCDRHAEVIPADLRSFGYVVTERYRIGDATARAAAESVETVSVDPYEFAAAFDPLFVPAPDDLGWQAF